MSNLMICALVLTVRGDDVLNVEEHSSFVGHSLINEVQLG